MNNRKNFLLVLSVLLVIAICLIAGYQGGRLAQSPSQVSGSDAMAEIAASKRLRVGYIVFPPAVAKDPATNNPTGHMIDVAKYLASELNAEADFQETTFATFSAGLQSKQFDVVVAPLFATPTRATAVAFTEPLYYLGLAVIAKNGDSRFKSIGDLNNPNIQIAVNQGGANQRFAKQNCPNAKLTELSTADISQVLSEVVAGRADVAIADTWSVSKFTEQNKSAVQILFSGRSLDTTAVSWALRPEDRRLRDFFNTSIEYLQTTGKMREFEQKYDAHWLHQKREWEQD